MNCIFHQRTLQTIDLQLRKPNPRIDVLPKKAVLIFPWDANRKMDEIYPFALFMIGENIQNPSVNENHYVGYWMWQEKLDVAIILK